MNKEDHVFYLIGKVIFFPLILFGVIFSNYVYPLYFDKNPMMECRLRKYSGYPCPGCGGTRAFVYLFKGELLNSIIYNPAVVIALILYIHYMVVFFIRKNIKKNINEKPLRYDLYFYVFIFIILLQWILKLIIIFKFRW